MHVRWTLARTQFIICPLVPQLGQGGHDCPSGLQVSVSTVILKIFCYFSLPSTVALVKDLRSPGGRPGGIISMYTCSGVAGRTSLLFGQWILGLITGSDQEIGQEIMIFHWDDFSQPPGQPSIISEGTNWVVPGLASQLGSLIRMEVTPL